MSFGRIVANLDFEESLAAEQGGPRRRLTARAATSARMLGTLLRVFASGEDRIWLPETAPAGRVASVPGLRTPQFETGALRTLPPADDWLAWGETEAVASLRARDLPNSQRPPGGEELPLWARVWRLPRTIPPVAKHVHQRSTHVKIAAELGLEFPGRKVVTSIEALNQHLAEGAARSSPTGEWILKPMFSAAGRNWIRGIGRAVERQAKIAAEKQFEEGRALLFEPLLERVRDIGTSLAITETGVEVIGTHQLEISSSGKFRGVRIPVRDVEGDSFPEEARTQAERIGERLHAMGFRGPCGIDAWCAKTREGDLHKEFLGEINARLTFGWLAHAWRSRLAEVGQIEHGGPLDLRTSSETGPPRAGIPLVTPGDHDTLCAWIAPRGRDSSLRPR